MPAYIQVALEPSDVVEAMSGYPSFTEELLGEIAEALRDGRLRDDFHDMAGSSQSWNDNIKTIAEEFQALHEANQASVEE